MGEDNKNTEKEATVKEPTVKFVEDLLPSNYERVDKTKDAISNKETDAKEDKFEADKLNIPDYQRPYMWSTKNVNELLCDIDTAIAEYNKYKSVYHYRLGTVILHNNTTENTKDIVDGQQRLITLALIKLAMDKSFDCPLFKHKFKDKKSIENIYNNYQFIKSKVKETEYIESLKKAFKEILQMVVIEVNETQEAFQLFDSQNSRGKCLDPHDLLKAYHLREMKDTYSNFQQQEVVKRWEDIPSKEIRELFAWYLFPILNWSRKEKTVTFTANEKDVYKGVRYDSPYNFARRTLNAMPYFQINEPFIAGKDFFDMVEHYIQLKREINNIFLSSNNKLIESITNILNSFSSTGFMHAKTLFICAMMLYCDKFGCLYLDERAVKIIFKWAMAIRLEKASLSYNTINNYAIGDNRYKLKIPMFFLIANARVPSDISNIVINLDDIELKESKRSNKERVNLKTELEKI